jgi:hypothetical protein
MVGIVKAANVDKAQGSITSIDDKPPKVAGGTAV